MWVTSLVPEFSYGAESISMATMYDQDIQITRPYPKRSFVQSYDGGTFLDVFPAPMTPAIAEFSFSFRMRVSNKAYESTAAAVKKYIHTNLFLNGKRDGNLAGSDVILKTAVQRMREERQSGFVKWTIEGQCLPFWYDKNRTDHWTPLTNAVATNNYSYSLANTNYTGDVFNIYDDFCQVEFVASAGTHSYSGLWFLPSHYNNDIIGGNGDEKTETYGGPLGNGPSVSYPTNKLVFKPNSLTVRNNSTDAFVSDGTAYCVRPTYAGVVNYTNGVLFGLFKGQKPFIAHIFTASIATTLNGTVRFRNLWW